MDNDIYNKDITDGSSFVGTDDGAIIKVIGIGGGGGNAVNYMFKQKIPHINFVVCNTDRQALNMSPVPNQLLLGKEVTKGRGAGNKPAVGRQCAEASVDDIRSIFDDETEMVFITAGMGGGTGTGAAPVVAQIAKECGMLTIGIVTVPFKFEGDKKILMALEGAAEMRTHVDALLIINNENLIELYEDYNFFNAFSKADDTLANAARSISEIISEPCYVNVDFQDVKTTLKDSGSAIIATATGEGENRVTNAIQNALHSPLMKAHDIYSSKRLLIKFMCSKDSKNPIKSKEMAEIHNFLTSKLPPTIEVKWGIGDDPTLEDKIKVTILASGFDVTIREKDEKNKKGMIDFPGSPAAERAGAADKEEDTPSVTQEDIAAVYGREKVKEWKMASIKQKYVVLKPSQFDDHETIMLLERVPAYNRDIRFNQQLEHLDSAEPEKPAARPDDTNGGTVISF